MKLYKSDVVAIAAGSALTAGTILGIQGYAEAASDPPEVLQNIASTLGYTALERCSSVTDRQISEARNILLEETHGDVFTLANYEEMARVAESTGFTVHRPDLVINEIHNMSDYDEIFARAKEYLQGFGVRLIMQDDNMARHDFTVDKLPESFEGNIDHAKHKLSELIKAFGRLPVEFIGYSGVRQVVISGSLTKYYSEDYTAPINEAAGLAVEGEAIYLDEKFFDMYTVWHEIAHFIDWKMCGTTNYSIDVVYAGLNEPGYIYEGHEWDDGYDGFKFVSAYSESEIAEDKAEVMMNMFHSNEQVPLIKCGKSCPIFEKFALLMARLESELPGITYYLSQIDQEGVQ